MIEVEKVDHIWIVKKGVCVFSQITKQQAQQIANQMLADADHISQYNPVVARAMVKEAKILLEGKMFKAVQDA